VRFGLSADLIERVHRPHAEGGLLRRLPAHSDFLTYRVTGLCFRLSLTCRNSFLNLSSYLLPWLCLTLLLPSLRPFLFDAEQGVKLSADLLIVFDALAVRLYERFEVGVKLSGLHGRHYECKTCVPGREGNHAP
jgi:hypothetical protein